MKYRNIFSFSYMYRRLIKFLIIFIYLWKPQNIILNIVPEWLGKSQENFHTFLFWANLSTTGS